MLALDLGVFHRKDHEVKMKEALVWSGVWVALGLAFSAVVYWRYVHLAAGFDPAAVATPESAGFAELRPHSPGDAVVKYLTGYLIEKALSVDNIFVFLMIFTYFRVPVQYHHKVLFWGILGALALRAVFILAGVTLLEKFHWMIYVFGAILILTGVKMVLAKDKEIHPERNPVLRLFRRFFRVTPDYREGHFFANEDGRWTATPLLVALLIVETTDVVFAVDSIPAILAITTDPFLVYTSNVFAILGLRALYFALAGLMSLFTYLTYGLAAILVFVGAKMCLVDFYKVPTFASLGIVALILIVSIVASLARKRSHAA
jgi:tellurite resistance protein TerC